MFLSEGETITCEHCGKTITVTEDDPASSTWMSVSSVSYDEEEPLYLFCSFDCLEKWMRLTEKERLDVRERNELNWELDDAIKKEKEKQKE